MHKVPGVISSICSQKIADTGELLAEQKVLDLADKIANSIKQQLPHYPF